MNYQQDLKKCCYLAGCHLIIGENASDGDDSGEYDAKVEVVIRRLFVGARLFGTSHYNLKQSDMIFGFIQKEQLKMS